MRSQQCRPSGQSTQRREGRKDQVITSEKAKGCGGKAEPLPPSSPGDRLDVDGQLQLRQLVHVLVDGLAHLGHANQLPDLAVAQVVEPLPREVLLLDPPDDILWQLLELAKRSHGQPPGQGRRGRGRGGMKWEGGGNEMRGRERVRERGAWFLLIPFHYGPLYNTNYISIVVMKN